MGDMFFTMMDKDKDGQLSKEEVGKLAEMMAAMPGVWMHMHEHLALTRARALALALALTRSP